MWYREGRPKWLGPIPYDYPDHLQGEAPGDYGFDVLGLALNPVDFEKYFKYVPISISIILCSVSSALCGLCACDCEQCYVTSNCSRGLDSCAQSMWYAFFVLLSQITLSTTELYVGF